jgi:hypothetical protein
VVLDDGPPRRERIEAHVVQARPPSTIDAPVHDGSNFPAGKPQAKTRDSRTPQALDSA